MQTILLGITREALLLLDQLPLRPDGIKHLQQQGSQNILRRYLPTIGRGVQLVELHAQRPQNLVGQLPHRSQRVVLRNALFQRHIAKHPILKLLISTHSS